MPIGFLSFYPISHLFCSSRGTLPHFLHSTVIWGEQRGKTTLPIFYGRIMDAPHHYVHGMCKKKNNVTVIKWLWACACFLTCTVTSYTLSADYFKDKNHFCAQTDVCLPCVRHQQRSHLSSVYLEQNNKLPILAGSLCPPRSLCFSALSFLHPLQNFAQVSPHFVHVTLYLWRKSSKASYALISLLWCKYIYSSPTINEMHGGIDSKMALKRLYLSYYTFCMQLMQ